MPASTLAAATPDPLPDQIRVVFAASGLSEAWISSLTSLDDLDGRKTFARAGDDAVSVQNPLSSEHQILRQSLIPGLIRAASYNQDRGNANPCLFELGKSYRCQPRRFNKQLPAGKQTSTSEELLAAAIVCGEPRLSQWLESDKRQEGNCYYLVKGILESLAAGLNISLTSLSFQSVDNVPGWFHPGRSAACFVDMSQSQKSDKPDTSKQKGNKMLCLGYLGEIHPAVANTYKLSGRAAILEISLAALGQAKQPPVFKDIYQTPVIQRDLTCDLDNSVDHQSVEMCINACGGSNLQKVILISLFQLSATQKSLSYRLTFQHPELTLTNDAVDSLMAKIREELMTRLNASFRL